MPVLPSGMKLALSAAHIMQPDRNWFKAPENHFWYWTSSPHDPPPFSSQVKHDEVAVTAEVPESREMMERYIRVGIGLANGKMYWRGEMLSDFPKYGMLTDEDSRAWRDWLSGDEVKQYLDDTIIRCQMQSIVNREASGFAMFSNVEAAEGEEGYTGKKIIDNPLINPH